MEITTYAPVLIPTLNRYEHFKRCLESLEHCTGADKTDVYVGLDFPPAEKYADGWKKIDEYLSEKVKNHGFRNLFVRKRETNCGVGKPNSNATLLRKEIESSVEYYISSEDDNEFSPNFLEYMNKCLLRFKDDDRIIKVCGYNFEMEFPEMYRNNFYLSKTGCAWGTGSWVKKMPFMSKYYNLDYLRNIVRNDITYGLLLNRNSECINYIIWMLKSRRLHGDAIWEIYCVLEDKYIILPTKSKSRNHGNDGTGTHSLKMDTEQNEFYSKQEMDGENTFEFTDDVFTYEPLYLKRNNFKPQRTIKTIYKDLVMKLDIFLLRKFDYIPTSRFF